VSGTGLLPRAGILIALLLSGSAVRGEDLRIVSPEKGSILLGTTVVRLEADPATAIERVDLYVNGKLVGSAAEPDWSVTWEAESGVETFMVLAVGFSNGEVVAKSRSEFPGASFHQYERVDLVQLYPVVLSPAGSYVRNLSRDDFRVYEEEVEIPIRHFATEVSSLSIVLLLDVSESMSGKLGQLQNASTRFVDDLGESDQVSLHVFDHASRELVGLTVDHEKVKDRIWDLEPSGGTALYDAILKVVVERLGSVPGRKALFVFSDGIDQHSFTSLDRVLLAAREHNVIFYTVGFGEDDQSVAARKDLSALADQTGGKAYFIRWARQIEGTFDSILVELRAQYVISYKPPEGEAGFRTIRLEVTGGRFGTRTTEALRGLGVEPAGYKVRYRRGYYYTPDER
jgi:VWFA-related protein